MVAVKVTALPEVEGVPDVARVRKGIIGLTVKVVEAVAGLYVAVAAWEAVTVTCPAPLMVRVEPESVAGPEATL